METRPRELPPYDVSVITDQLFIAAKPRRRNMESVRGLKVDLVISMIGLAPTPELTRPPFRLLRMPTFDFPLLPIPLAILRQGVKEALPVLESGGRVLVYCRAGRHRSVAMAASILIAQGMSADEAMNTIVVHRPVADPHAYYIESRIRAFEADWRRQHAPATAS